MLRPSVHVAHTVRQFLYFQPRLITQDLNHVNITRTWSGLVISGASAASLRNLWRCMGPLSCHSPTLRRALTPEPIERRAIPSPPATPKFLCEASERLCARVCCT